MGFYREDVLVKMNMATGLFLWQKPDCEWNNLIMRHQISKEEVVTTNFIGYHKGIGIFISASR